MNKANYTGQRLETERLRIFSVAGTDALVHQFLIGYSKRNKEERTNVRL